MQNISEKMYFHIFLSAVLSLPAADSRELHTSTAPSSDKVKELIPLYLRRISGIWCAMLCLCVAAQDDVLQEVVSSAQGGRLIAAEPCEPHEEDSEIPNQTAQEAVIHTTPSVNKHLCAFICNKNQEAMNLHVILSFSIMLEIRSPRRCFLLDHRLVSLSFKASASASDEGFTLQSSWSSPAVLVFALG